MKKILMCLCVLAALSARAILDDISLSELGVASAASPVVVGEWHGGFEKCIQKANEAGLPLIAVWTRSELQNSLVAIGCKANPNMRKSLASERFVAWRKNGPFAGRAVFLFMESPSGFSDGYGGNGYVTDSDGVKWMGVSNVPSVKIYWRSLDGFEKSDVFNCHLSMDREYSDELPERLIKKIEASLANVVLPHAINEPSLNVESDSDAAWFGQTAVSHDGSSAARSGQIGANQSSSMQTTVTGPADISFWWKVSSESVSYDYLEFLIDDEQKDKIGGTGGSWAQKTYSIGSGSHTLKWNYRKDGSIDGGDDCGWVDQLVVTSNSPTWPNHYRTTFSSSDLRLTEVGGSYYQPVVMDPGGANGTQRLYERLSWAYYPAPPCPYSRAGYAFAGWEFYSACYLGSKLFWCKGIDCGGLVEIKKPGELLDICGVSALVAQWKAVSAKPVIVCESSYTVTPGKSCSIPIKAESTVKKTSVTVSKLPKGLSFKNGTITGKVAKPGTTKVKVVAKNSKGTTTKYVTIKAINPGFNVTLTARPNGASASSAQTVENSGDAVQVYVGVQQTIVITSTPAVSGVSSSFAKVTVSGLPKGLTYKSGKISGVVRTTGSKTVTVKFKNKWGWSKSFKIVIKAVSLPPCVRGAFNGFVSADVDWLYVHQYLPEDYDVYPQSYAQSYVYGKTYALKVSSGNTGKLSAKLGSASFTASKWASAVDGVFKATLTNKNKKLVVIVDTNVTWPEASMTVSYSPPSSVYPYPGYAVRNPFGKSISGAYSNALAGHYVKLLTKLGTDAGFVTRRSAYGYDLDCWACVEPEFLPLKLPLSVKVSSAGVATLTGKIGSQKISATAVVRITQLGNALVTYIVGGMAVDLTFSYEPAEEGYYDDWGYWVKPRVDFYWLPNGNATFIK